MIKKFLLTWNAPTNAATTGYIIEYSQNNATWTEYIEKFITTSGFVTGLDACENYYFRVAGSNLVGTGSFSSSASGIMGLIPYAPINISGNPSDTSISLSWTMPNNGGCPITGSYIEYSGDGSLATGLATSGDSQYLLTGLLQDTSYTIKIAAINIVGVGPYSTGYVVSTILPEEPDPPEGLSVQYIEVLEAPTGLSLSINSTTGNLTWNALDMTNKIPLSGYYIRYKNISSENWTTSTLFSTNSGTIGSLTGVDCYSYEFGVAGLNTSGTIGTYSNSITGNFGTPAAPTNISISNLYNTEYGISWTTPSSTPSVTGFNMYMTGIKINNNPFDPAAGSFSNNGYVSYSDMSFYYSFSVPITGGTMTVSAVNACGEGPQSTGVIVAAYEMG